jgi:hypothetical protein
MRKSSTCPSCRREDIKGVKIYCNTCRWRYYICTRSLVAANAKDLPMKCDDCHRSEQTPEAANIELLLAQGLQQKMGAMWSPQVAKKWSVHELV